MDTHQNKLNIAFTLKQSVFSSQLAKIYILNLCKSIWIDSNCKVFVYSLNDFALLCEMWYTFTYKEFVLKLIIFIIFIWWFISIFWTINLFFFYTDVFTLYEIGLKIKSWYFRANSTLFIHSFYTLWAIMKCA